jgi:hypothetical protein
MEGQRRKMFQKRQLRRIFGTIKEVVENRIMRGFIICTSKILLEQPNREE